MNAQRGEAALTLRTLKVRDAERPEPLHLVRRRVEVAASDGDRRPLTSCIVERDLRTRAAVRADEDRTVETAQRAVDLPVRDRQVSSRDALRAVVGLKRDLVVASLARILSAGWMALPGRQRQPYALTPAGHAALGELP